MLLHAAIRNVWPFVVSTGVKSSGSRSATGTHRGPGCGQIGSLIARPLSFDEVGLLGRLHPNLLLEVKEAARDSVDAFNPKDEGYESE